MVELTESDFHYEIEECDRLCVIDIYADWCGPCRMLSPVLSELEKEYKDVKFCKINADEQSKLVEIFKVTELPTVAFVKNDTYLDMSIGFVPKDTLKKMIEEYM